MENENQYEEEEYTDDSDFEDEHCDGCGREYCVCDEASGCTCGAWVCGANGVVHVADCICGCGL